MTVGPTRVGRRELLLSASALAALGLPVGFVMGRTSGARAAAIGAVSRMIDVHCHIFNAQDVPAPEFLLNVVAREMDIAPSIARLASFVTRLLTRFAPSASAEERYIQRSADLKDVKVGDDEFHRQVLTILDELAQRAKTVGLPAILADPLTKNLQRSGISAEDYFVTRDGQTPSPEANALAELQKLYPPTAVPTPAPPSADSRVQSLMALGVPPTAIVSSEARAEMASAIVVATLEKPTEVKDANQDTTKDKVDRFMGMVRDFLSYRVENVLRLDRDVRLSGALPAVRLYCPALVDYDLWLGTGFWDRSTRLSRQAQLMSTIALRTPADLLVNGYMAFDPLRAAIAKLRPTGGAGTPFEVVKDALEHRGFIGVKLYPPMGFRPLGNAGARQAYGKYVPDLLLRHSLTVGDEFESALDEVLEQLYAYCLAEEVPILAHCSNSQTAFEDSGLRAAPEYWGAVLKRYPGLRINLAHLGSIWCHVDTPPKAKSNDEERCMAADRWSRNVMELLTAPGPGNANLYTDLADVAALTFDRPDQTGPGLGRTSLKETLTDLQKGFDPAQRQTVLTKLLYGTDWMFLSMYPGFKSFAEGAKQFADMIPIAPDDLLWKNGARFLGLTKGSPGGQTSKTVQRLTDFYRDLPDKRASLNNLLV